MVRTADIHLAPKALCLFNARRQYPPKNDKFMNQFHMPFDRQSKLSIYFKNYPVYQKIRSQIFNQWKS